MTPTTSAVRLTTADEAAVFGLLRIPAGGARTVVSIMHPREDVAHHPLVGALLDMGVAVWTQGTRSPNNDVRLLHEQALLDVAAGQAFLREQGFEARIALGHSGGATLFAFYEQQARLAPAQRLTAAPDGTPVELAAADMPPPDGAIFMAPHPGQGELLRRLIDPSVVDEADAHSVDPALDPFDPRNGFAPAPQTSTYEPAFVERYRAAQDARIRRLDAVATGAADTARHHRRSAAESGDVRERRLGLTPTIMVVHRTDADLRSLDLSLDPNERPYGSLFGRRPDLGNYGFAGFCRITTPAAWLSTWSATTSRAGFVTNAAGVSSPSLLIELTGDQACFPADARLMHLALAAADKTHVRVAGTHFGGPIARGEPTGTELSARQIRRWLDERFDIA